MAKDIAVHPEPVWRERANFLIFADLAEHGLPGRWEQLWARQEGDEFVLCCIPFFTYGLALGDRVRTAPREDKRHVIVSREAGSGRSVSRLWFKGAKSPSVRGSVERFLQDRGWLYEWSSDNLLALDLPDEQATEEFKSFAREQSREHGLMVESGAEN